MHEFFSYEFACKTGGFYTQHDYVERQSYTSFIGSIRRLMPYVSLTVSDLLWGYEDVLIKITRKLGYLSVPRDAFGFFLDVSSAKLSIKSKMF